MDSIFSAFADSQPGAWVQDGMIIAPPVRPVARPASRAASSTVRKITITFTATVAFLVAPTAIPLRVGAGPVAVVIPHDILRSSSAHQFDVVPTGAVLAMRDHLRKLLKAPPPDPLDLECLV